MNYSNTFALFQEDRAFLAHVERSFLALLQRDSITPDERKTLLALVAGLRNLPFVTPGLNCTFECSPFLFQINEEEVSFDAGSCFVARFGTTPEDRWVGSRLGEDRDPIVNYHKWKVHVESFETDLSDPETPFYVEFFGAPKATEGEEVPSPCLTIGERWSDLPSWKSQGINGIADIQS